MTSEGKVQESAANSNEQPELPEAEAPTVSVAPEKQAAAEGNWQVDDPASSAPAMDAAGKQLKPGSSQPAGEAGSLGSSGAGIAGLRLAAMGNPTEAGAADSVPPAAARASGTSAASNTGNAVSIAAAEARFAAEDVACIPHQARHMAAAGGDGGADGLQSAVAKDRPQGSGDDDTLPTDEDAMIDGSAASSGRAVPPDASKLTIKHHDSMLSQWTSRLSAGGDIGDFGCSAAAAGDSCGDGTMHWE